MELHLLQQNSPHLNRRYVVGYEPTLNNREIVFVYDKFVSRIIYKANTTDRKRVYPYIKEYYGVDNCVPPELRSVKDYS